MLLGAVELLAHAITISHIIMKSPLSTPGYNIKRNIERKRWLAAKEMRRLAIVYTVDAHTATLGRKWTSGFPEGLCCKHHKHSAVLFLMTLCDLQSKTCSQIID